MQAPMEAVKGWKTLLTVSPRKPDVTHRPSPMRSCAPTLPMVAIKSSQRGAKCFGMAAVATTRKNGKGFAPLFVYLKAARRGIFSLLFRELHTVCAIVEYSHTILSTTITRLVVLYAAIRASCVGVKIVGR